MLRNTSCKMIPLVLTSLIVSACTATSDPTKFYTLNPTQSVEQQLHPTAKTKTISIESITVPRILDRPQIVTRKGINEIKRSEFNQWGGSIVDEIDQLVETVLDAALASSNYTLLPKESRVRADLNLFLTLNRFDGELGETAEIELKWQLETERTSELLSQGRIQLSERLTSPNYSNYVAALQTLLQQSILSLAEELQKP